MAPQYVLRVPVMDEHSRDPPVAIELHHLELEARALLRKYTATELTPVKTSSNSNFRSGAAASPLAKCERSAALPRTVPAGSPRSFVTSSDLSSTDSA